MKSFKDLNEQLNEHHGGTSFVVPRDGAPVVNDPGGANNLFAIENPRIVDRMNAAISYVTKRPTMDPKAVVCDIKDKVLPHAGLSCDSYGEIGEGEHRFPLKQFNGRMGATPEEGVLNTNDDGITHKLGHGLDLMVTVIKGPNSLYKVEASIVPSMGDDAMGDNTYIG
tara:strand:+ start:75 stop:578 length:504 start_codon:yes stop_codon:yes gene_type:complete